MQRVQAAGGVIVNGERRILVVHRPRYNDWSFPKGKLEAGESLRECALREVLEETGWHCTLKDPLPTIGYVDHKGRDKSVYYWLMDPIEGLFEPNDEVDAIEWLTPSETAIRLTYGRDREVLQKAQDFFGYE